MEEYGVIKGDSIQLHGIIVTHPENDHMNGIKTLLEKHGQKILYNCDLVITRALFWRYRHRACKRFINLVYKTYHREDVKLQTSVTPGLTCHFPRELGCLCRHLPPKEDRIYIYRRLFNFFPNSDGINADESSILTALNDSGGKCDVVLTGDSYADLIMPLVRGKTIGIFQVPNHGTFYSSSQRHGQSSCRENITVREMFQDCSKQQVDVMLQKCHKKVEEVLPLYGLFKAKCYFISTGGTKVYCNTHPHFAVLQGIILANKLRKHECVILVTNSRGLDSEKLKQLQRLAPKWSRYVKLYHYDDLFFAGQCHTSLCPQKVISDVRASTVEWTPQGYMNALRKKLKTVTQRLRNCRLQVNQCFVDKSIVQVSLKGIPKFSAHIICVPLPHNPRSGVRVNRCYVLEESIAPAGSHFSQAMFLVDHKKKANISKAKSYTLVQYTSNE